MQIEGLKRDAARISAENNQLHLQLLNSADISDKAERDHYHHVKQLEGQISELACWKHQTAGRFKALETENSGLRLKLEELLRLGEKFPRRMAQCNTTDLQTEPSSNHCLSCTTPDFLVLQLTEGCWRHPQPYLCHTQ